MASKPSDVIQPDPAASGDAGTPTQTFLPTSLSNDMHSLVGDLRDCSARRYEIWGSLLIVARLPK
jgi:hypothetical protein